MTFPPPESLRPTVVGERHVVSAGHPLVAEVGLRVLDEGGNAVDAGVAAGLAANVVQPDMCNFGGIAPIVVRPGRDGIVYAVAGAGWWGSGATVAAHRERYGGDMPPGPAVAVVPGAPAAWIAALARFGTWSFARAAAPAIELAREGFPLDRRLAAGLAVTGRSFGRWESSRRIYWPEGRPPAEGDRLVQDDLGRLLERLAEAESGRTREEALAAVHRAFYEGEPAERIARFVADGGGWMTRADLAEFEAEVEPAVVGSYAGWTVAVPGTWTQGPALLQMLNVLAGLDLEALGHGSADYLHLLVETVKVAFADRERWYGDPRHVEVPLERLLSGEHADELRARISTAAALPAAETAAAARPAARALDTTYLCVVDGDGNAFSANASDTLDSSPIVPGLGILVSSRGLQSRLDPAHPACIAPRKRPRLTPAPAIASHPDGRVWALGCPGGDMILQAMLQVFLGVVHFGLTPQQAVEAPRVASFGFPNSFFPHAVADRRVLAEERIGERVAADLARRGHDVGRWPGFAHDAGGVCTALDLRPPADGRRVLGAAADPRRICYALGR